MKGGRPKIRARDVGVVNKRRTGGASFESGALDGTAPHIGHRRHSSDTLLFFIALIIDKGYTVIFINPNQGVKTP